MLCNVGMFYSGKVCMVSNAVMCYGVSCGLVW